MKFIALAYLCLVLVCCKELSSKNAQKINFAEDHTFRPLTDAEKAYYSQRVQGMYDSLLVRRGFNGSIIIAKNNEVLLEEYKGYADFETKDTITPTTAFHLASISKTFTGMAVLKLVEENKLSLLDSVQKFFPAFPYHNINIKLLLTHRSGLPNYAYFLTKDTTYRKRIATNQDMLDFMIAKNPQRYGYPDRGFNYCNTNYAMLALIIEKVTGQPYPDYMKSTVFGPLGMNNTFVFSLKDTGNYKPSYLANNRPIRLETMDCIYGDKNIYSTPRDILKWDAAMYKNSFVTQSTYQQAILPYSNERPSKHNYGMGWRLLISPESKIVYHNGWWHGNSNSFTRFIQDSATVIIIGNRYNRGNYAGMKFAPVFGSPGDTSRQVE